MENWLTTIQNCNNVRSQDYVFHTQKLLLKLYIPRQITNSTVIRVVPSKKGRQISSNYDFCSGKLTRKIYILINITSLLYGWHTIYYVHNHFSSSTFGKQCQFICCNNIYNCNVSLIACDDISNHSNKKSMQTIKCLTKYTSFFSILCTDT